MKKILFSLAFVYLFAAFLKADIKTMLVTNVFAADEIAVASDSKIFTVKELAEFDGKEGRKAYTSYKGLVYDVTESNLWKAGEHFGLKAGIDLTGSMAEAPHGEEVFTGFKVIGKLEGYETQEEKVSTTNDKVLAPNTDKTIDFQPTMGAEANSTVWYEKRIRIGSFSILGWTGIILGIFFVLTFASCFALPWAKLPLPWKGSKIGPDSLDDADKHMTWSSVHKHFVWVTVVFGIVHGIIGFLQMLGIYL